MKGKVYETLCKAYPLKKIETDLQLQGAVEAHDRVSEYLKKEEHIPPHQDQIEAYLAELEELISQFRRNSATH